MHKMTSFSLLILCCHQLMVKSSAFENQPFLMVNDSINTDDRRTVHQCGTCLCRNITANTVTLSQCSFNRGSNELLIKDIRHGKIAISKLIDTAKKQQNLIVIIEKTEVDDIVDLSQHMLSKVAKVVLKNNPKLVVSSSSPILLSGTMEVHPKGMRGINLISFRSNSWYFDGVDFGGFDLVPWKDWERLDTRKICFTGHIKRLPSFRENEQIESLEFSHVTLQDNQVPLGHNFLRGAKGLRTLVIDNSPSVSLPENVMTGMRPTQKIILRLDLPNIVQSSFYSIHEVKEINDIRITNKNKWNTALQSDCRYFCGDPLVEVTKVATPPQCPEHKNPQTFLCALCVRNRLGEKADFEITKSICGYNIMKSPDYIYDYGYNKATEQSPDFYKSAQNKVYPAWSTIIIIVVRILSNKFLPICIQYAVRN